MYTYRSINISKATFNKAFIQYRENEPISDSAGEVSFQNTSFNAPMNMYYIKMLERGEQI